MIGDRTRGVLLYACASVLLVVGGFWWFRAAPREVGNAEVEQWRASAEQLLPDIDGQRAGDTLALAAGVDHEVIANLANGTYQVSVVCVGGPSSQVRVSLGTDDSGRGLGCGSDQRAISFNVGLAGQLRMNVSVGDAGPVVFRYVMRFVD